LSAEFKIALTIWPQLRPRRFGGQNRKQRANTMQVSIAQQMALMPEVVERWPS
jgi:hypothetical protein